MRPIAEKIESTFRLRYAVSCEIRASAERLWALLTNAREFSTWNSTVESLGGKIALGEKLRIRVPLAPNRTFTPRVTVFEPTRRMQWSDGFAPMFRGVRTFTLSAQSDGTTAFAMEEEFSGVMLPLIKGSLPDFRRAFETYAADLKRAAEAEALS